MLNDRETANFLQLGCDYCLMSLYDRWTLNVCFKNKDDARKRNRIRDI